MEITIEDGVEGGIIEDTYISAIFPDACFGTLGVLRIGDSDKIRILIGVNLTDYTDIIILSAKFSAYRDFVGSIDDVHWYRVLRNWVEGFFVADNGLCSWILYDNPDEWETAGCAGATDRESTPQSEIPLSTSPGWTDFSCKPESVSLDLGSRFSIIVQKPTGAGEILFSSCEAASNHPTFYMEYTYRPDPLKGNWILGRFVHEK